MNQTRKTEIRLGNDLLEKMDLRSILYPLWLNKWALLIITLLCLFGGYKYSKSFVPQFTTNVLLQLEEKNNLLSLGKDFSAASLFGGKSTSNIGLHTALIKSRYVLEPVIMRLGMNIQAAEKYPEKPEAFVSLNHLKKAKISQFNIPAEFEDKLFRLTILNQNTYELYDSEDQLILKGKIGVIEEKPSEFGNFKIQIQSLNGIKNTNIYLVQRPLQPLINLLSNQLVINDLSQDMLLASPTGILKISLTGPDPQHIVNTLNTIAKVAVEKNSQKNLQEANRVLNFIKRQLPIVKKELDKAEFTLSQYLSDHGMIDLHSESRLLLNTLTQLQKDLYLLKMNRNAALQKYTSQHPVMIAFDAKEKSLNKQLKAIQKNLSQLPARDQAVLSLMRDVKVKNQIYLVLLQKVQQLQISKVGTISDINVLGLAPIPYSPLPSKTVKILLSSLLFGFIIGAVLVHAQRLWNRKISDPVRIEEEFDLPNLAIVPYADKQTNVVKFGRKNLVPLLAHTDPKNLSIEALRNLRTSVQFSMFESKNNIITITGISPGVGKSFISVNFAYLQADCGKKVLLIDGDIRKGRLKHYFQVGNTTGLTEVICNQTSFEEVVIEGPIPNLHFLSTGAYPSNPSELLMSSRFENILKTLSSQYDMIIIDTPPVLAVTDAAIIARHAGANFLVLAANTHETKEVDLALKQLSAKGIVVKGVIFNFSKKQKYLNTKKMSYQYQYEYK